MILLPAHRTFLRYQYGQNKLSQRVKSLESQMEGDVRANRDSSSLYKMPICDHMKKNRW